MRSLRPADDGPRRTGEEQGWARFRCAPHLPANTAAVQGIRQRKPPVAINQARRVWLSLGRHGAPIHSGRRAGPKRSAGSIRPEPAPFLRFSHRCALSPPLPRSGQVRRAEDVQVRTRAQNLAAAVCSTSSARQTVTRGLAGARQDTTVEQTRRRISSHRRWDYWRNQTARAGAARRQSHGSAGGLRQARCIALGGGGIGPGVAGIWGFSDQGQPYRTGAGHRYREVS